MKCVKYLEVREVKQNGTHAFFNRLDELILILPDHDIIVFHQIIVSWLLLNGGLSHFHIVHQYLVTVLV